MVTMLLDGVLRTGGSVLESVALKHKGHCIIGDNNIDAAMNNISKSYQRKQLRHAK